MKTITPSEKPHYATLSSKPVTDEARAFVSALREGIENHEKITGTRTYGRHGDMLSQFEFAVGAFLADLLRAAANDEAEGWVFRSMKAESFSGERVSCRMFRSIVRALTELQFIDAVPGYQRWASAGFDQEDNTHLVTEARAARYKATDSLLRLAEAKGITPQNAFSHFIQALPEQPIVLKAASTQTRGNKVSGRRMGVDRSPEVEKLEADVKRLNEFLDNFTLKGGIHRGYFRVFNLGDHPDFAWNKGGRLYSQGESSYQRLKEAERVLMRINEEPMVEIDIKASYLTILHGLVERPFDPTQDPYEVEGLKPLPGRDLLRWVVKSWTVATLGHHHHHTRWPNRIISEYNEKTGRTLGRDYPIRTVREAMEVKHPLLKEWGSLGLSWADLMFVESDAVIATMLELMDGYEAPSFSVHDSLIVRENDLETAKDALTRNYEAACGLKPSLEVTFSDGVVE